MSHDTIEISISLSSVIECLILGAIKMIVPFFGKGVEVILLRSIELTRQLVPFLCRKVSLILRINYLITLNLDVASTANCWFSVVRAKIVMLHSKKNEVFSFFDVSVDGTIC
ncbi:hypothetical protein KFK09_008701 [Dendrobium nobile]|uniref:Uncharacterized protein n=1 Tax=Dendrobium nobile TaxID=94219 RepID=A0A8T3BNH0_DENNO|nr:hypothetical protein KFK09_008701 [Dendrobium nobile]